MALSNGTTLRIDKSGRIVVPKPLRERLGLKPDSELEAVEQAGGVLLRAVEQRPSMIKIDGSGCIRRGATGGELGRVVQDVREGRMKSVRKT